MIDPRALQQHFLKVHQKETPKKQGVPRVPNLTPLTAMQAIPMLVDESVEKQQEVINPSLKLTQAEIPKIVLETPKEKINLVINEPLPIDQIVINDFEEVVDGVVEKNEEEYDPYGYYSGPRF